MTNLETEWKTVYVAQGMAQASIVSGRLETEGIPTELKYEAAGRIYGLTVDGLGEVKIQVPASLLEQARRVLMEIYREDEIPWDS
jgi:hypothetical protein